jgi:hypothetical protein
MDNLLLEIGGKELYLDIDRMSEIVRIDPESMRKEDVDSENEESVDSLPDSPIHIDVTKYEMYREMIGALMMYNEEVDNKMGIVALNNATIPFKLAFNTLLMKGILKEL